MNIYLFCYEGPRRGSRYRDHGKGDRERVPSGSGGYHAGDSCHNVAGEHLFTLVQLIFARPKIWRCKAMLQVWPTKMWASKWTPLTWMKLKNTQTQFFVSKIDFILSIRSQRKSNQPYIFERDLRKNFILFRLLIRPKKTGLLLLAT